MRIFLITLVWVLISHSLLSQSRFIRVQYISKYYYKIQNSSGVTLEFDFPVSLGKETLPFRLARGRFKIFSRYDHLSDNLYVNYPADIYLARKASLEKNIAYYVGWDKVRDVIHDNYQKQNFRNIERQSGGETLFNALLGYAVNSYAEERLQAKLRPLARDYDYNEFMSNVVFGQETIYERLKLEKKNRRNFLSRVIATGSFPLVKSALSDVWDNKGSTSSFAFSASVLLSPEIRWGSHSRVFSRLYSFVDYQVDVHNLKDDSESLVVGSDYVALPDRDFYTIISDRGRSLRLQTLSVGGHFRTLFYPNFFFDLGVGYILSQTGILHFQQQDSNDRTIRHLAFDGELNQSKFRDAADAILDQDSQLFGVITLGVNAGRVSFGYPPNPIYYFIQGRVFRRAIVPSSSNQLFREVVTNQDTQETEVEKLSFVDDLGKIRLALHIGLGISF